MDSRNLNKRSRIKEDKAGEIEKVGSKKPKLDGSLVKSEPSETPKQLTVEKNNDKPPKKLLSFKNVKSEPLVSGINKPTVLKTSTSLLSTLIPADSNSGKKSLFKINKAAANLRVTDIEKAKKKGREPKVKKEKNDKGFLNKFKANDRFEQVSGTFSQGVSDSSNRKERYATASAVSKAASLKRSTVKKHEKFISAYDESEIDLNIIDEPSEYPVILGCTDVERKPKLYLKEDLKCEDEKISLPSTSEENVKVEKTHVKREIVENEPLEDWPEMTSLILGQLPDRLPFDWPKEKMVIAGELEVRDGKMIATLGGMTFEFLPSQSKDYVQEALSVSLFESDARNGHMQSLGRIKENYAFVPLCLKPPLDPSDEPEPL